MKKNKNRNKNKKTASSAPALKKVDKAKSVDKIERIEKSEAVSPEKKRRFTRKTLIKVMFVISIIFIMISLTYSWFTESNSARATVNNINVTDPNNLITGGEFAMGKIDSITGNGTSFFKPVLEEQLVATEGGYNIYQKVNTGEYTVLSDDVVSEDADVESLFIQDFSLSINGKHNLYLTNGSGIVTKDGSAAYLAGAMRVAIMKFNEQTSQYELCLVWIPDVTSQKSGTDLLDDKVVVVSPDVDGSKVEEITITSNRGETTLGGVRYVWGKIDANSSTNIFVGELDGTSKYRCVIWLDGNDRECNVELLDKEIVATFKFYPEAIGGNANE